MGRPGGRDGHWLRQRGQLGEAPEEQQALVEAGDGKDEAGQAALHTADGAGVERDVAEADAPGKGLEHDHDKGRAGDEATEQPQARLPA